MNDIVRLFNDEAVVRAAAQRAVDAALARPPAQGPALWQAAREVRFMTCVSFSDFADFEPA
jgi:hypothetical protein